MQAKDLPDADVLAAVAALQAERGVWAMRWDVAARFPGAPDKVVLAKLRALIRRGLLTGCGCGCRGDLEVTDAGRALIAVSV